MKKSSLNHCFQYKILHAITLKRRTLSGKAQSKRKKVIYILNAMRYAFSQTTSAATLLVYKKSEITKLSPKFEVLTFSVTFDTL